MKNKIIYGNVGKGVGGCVDHCLILCSVLRELGFRAAFIRFGRAHSVTLVEFKGKYYYLDTLGKYIQPLSENMKKFLGKEVREGNFGIGKDAWDIGMKSFKDFEKYPLKKPGKK